MLKRYFWSFAMVSLWVLLPCSQVRGHQIAKLDPLGISCVNFDNAPVTVGFHQVGEKCLLCAVCHSLCVNIALCPSVSVISLVFLSSLSPSHICPVLLGFLCCLVVFSLDLRFAGTTLHSWTLLELWMLISMRVYLQILSHPLINSVRFLWVVQESVFCGTTCLFAI